MVPSPSSSKMRKRSRASLSEMLGEIGAGPPPRALGAPSERWSRREKSARNSARSTPPSPSASSSASVASRETRASVRV